MNQFSVTLTNSDPDFSRVYWEPQLLTHEDFRGAMPCQESDRFFLPHGGGLQLTFSEQGPRIRTWNGSGKVNPNVKLDGIELEITHVPLGRRAEHALSINDAEFVLTVEPAD